MALDEQLLSPAAPTIDPESQIGIGGGIKRVVSDVNTLPRAGDGYTDRIRARMDWRGIVIVERGPSPVLPTILEGIGIDRLIGLGR